MSQGACFLVLQGGNLEMRGHLRGARNFRGLNGAHRVLKSKLNLTLIDGIQNESATNLAKNSQLFEQKSDADKNI